MELRSYKDDDEEHDEQQLLGDSPQPRQSTRPAWLPSNRNILIGVGSLVAVILVMTWLWSGHYFNKNKSHPKLRILALGDSITEGYMSSDGNGYRLPLLNLLEKNGSHVEFVGSVRSGNMSQNHHCGFGGWTISEINEKVKECVEEKPNLVLLHAGTNDMNADPPLPNEPYHDAPYRLAALIDAVLIAAPKTTLILAQIVQSMTPETAERIKIFNPMIPPLAEERTKKGERIIVVDMEGIGGNETTSADGLHPNDRGYGMMAKVWAEGISEAIGKGWVESVIDS